jgi:hypothetical protein
MRYLIFLIAVACTTKNESANLFSKGVEKGVISKRVEEASGLVASETNPGYFWTFNDGGNPAEIFLINTKAEIVMSCKLAMIINRDWEAIAIGAGPEEGSSYLYVGDIGDNQAKFPFKIVYRFVEPKLSEPDITITEFDSIVFQLSDGVRDTEAMVLDPISKDLFIFSKREDSIRVYQISYPIESRDTLLAEMKTKLPLSRIVAADISIDGSELLVKDYDHVYYWKRKEGLSIPELLKTKPVELPYEREPQGEAIAWQRDGAGFYTLSETIKNYRGRLLFYERNGSVKTDDKLSP